MANPEQNDWENDPVWSLVDRAPSSEAKPAFVQDVMREVRLLDDKESPWWRVFFLPQTLVGGAVAAVLALILVFSLPSGEKDSNSIADTPTTPEPVETVADSKLDTLVEKELLLEAAEDPSAFSDEELLALLY